MDSLLRLLCLLCVLITPGHSFKCISCDGQPTCTLSNEDCEPNHVCGTFFRRITESGVTTTKYIRSCVPTNKCDKIGTISFTGGKMTIGISCCTSENCAPILPAWPSESLVYNGRVCSSCRLTPGIVCTPDSKIACTGAENTCIYQKGWLADMDGDSAFGCATPSLCELADYNSIVPSGESEMQLYCFAAGSSCIVCSSDNSLMCPGMSTAITENSHCSSAYMISTVGQTNTYQVTRSWVSASKCNITGSMTVADSKYLMGISCCYGDDCTPSVQNTTPASTVSNGMQCKTCESANSNSCETNTTMNCTGQENQCVTHSLQTSYGTISTTSSKRGCGTKSLCDAQSYSFTKDYMTYVHSFACEPIPVNPTETTTSNGGNSTTAPNCGGNSITTPNNGWNNITTHNNGGNSITTPSNGGVIYLLLFTAASMLILLPD